MNTTNTFDKDSLIQVLDNLGIPLLIMPLAICLKQKLTREIAIVFIKNNENKLIICKNKALRQNTKNAKQANLWDIPIHTNIYADEIAEEAALRVLYEEFKINPPHLQNIMRIPLTQDDNMRVFANIFITKKIEFQEEKNTVYRLNKELMFVSFDELEALVNHSPEIFTAQLVWAVQAAWIK